MVDVTVRRWQNMTISAASDFRGPLMMALPIAAFWFLWQWLSLPGMAGHMSALPALLGFMLDKARYMPDFALILAGFVAFHFQRDLREGLNMAAAFRMFLRLLTPILGYFLAALILFEAVGLLWPAHHLALPWADPLFGPAFWIMATMTVGLILLPPFMCFTWTSIPDVCWAIIATCLACYGLSFWDGFHHHLWLWPINAVLDFVCGVSICSTLFRAVEMFAAVRGPTIILGWIVLLAGSILTGPTLFFVGFVMILSGMAIGERSWYLPGERGLLSWSRTALPFALAQPAVLTAWSFLPLGTLKSSWLGALAAALAIQIVAVVLFTIIVLPTRHLLAGSTARPAVG